MPIPNEPAGRLLALLDAAAQKNQGASLGTEWSKVFGLRWPDDFPILIRRIAAMLALPEQIRSRVEAVALDEEDLLLRHMDDVENALSHFHSMANSLGSQLALIRPEVRYSLEMCSRILRRLSPEGQIDDEQIERLHLLVADLIDEVQASALEEDLTDFLLSNLMVIRRGLREATIGGVRRVEQALDQVVGSAVRRPAVVERVREQEPAVAKKFGSILAQLAIAVGVGSGLAQLPGQVKEMLELGDEPSPTVVVIKDEREPPSRPGDDPPALPGPADVPGGPK